MGVFFQQSGWLAHDFLHGQVFESRDLNEAFGYAPLQGLTLTECQVLCAAIEGNNGTCVGATSKPYRKRK